MSRSALPPNWNNKLIAVVLVGVVIFIGGIVYFSAQTAVAAIRGSVPAALTAGGIVVFFCGFAGAFCVTLLASATRYAAWSGSGTTVRIHPAIMWSYGIALAGGIVGSACYLAFVSRGVVNLPFTVPGNETFNRYLMITLLVLCAVGFFALLHSREPGYLRVGVDGVEHADMFRTRFASWHDIGDITDKAGKQARNPIVISVKGAEPVVVPNADRLASSGPALYWMVRHYWKHPENRAELTDGRALDRLRNEQFDPE